MVWTNPTQLWGLIKESVSGWSDDYASSMGAAIAYYTLFSVAPLLIIVIGVAGLVFGQDAAQGAIFDQLRGLLGPEGASAIEGLVKSASEPAKSTIATIVGVVTLLIGATTVFAELQNDLDRIWEVPAEKKASGIWNLIRTRLLSLGLVLAMGFLLTVSLVLSAALAALGKLYGGFFDNFEWLLQLVNFVVSFVVITGLFAMVYKLLPRAEIGWHDVWIGAAVTALLFDIGRFLIGLYLGKSSVVSGFGAAGSIVLLILWMYYSAQIFLLGAEFTWAYAHRYGSRRNQQSKTSAARTATSDSATGHSATGHSGLSDAAAAAAAAAFMAVDVDELPAPSSDEIVEVVPAVEYRNDTATRAARAADRHPRLSLAAAAIGLAAAGFAYRLITERRRATVR